MEKLEPPIKKYLMGKLPTHSSTTDLASNFKELDSNALLFVFHKADYLTMDFKPTKTAVADGLIDTCEKKVLWNLDSVLAKLNELGLKAERAFVNQEIKGTSNGEPRWVNLGTLATYFCVTANTVGKWLDDLDLRDEEKMGSQEAVDRGLSLVSEMNAGGKKTRKISMWDLYPTQKVLIDAGHALDFDYAESLKGKGKSSDVKVTTIDDRARDFAKEFSKLFKNPETRKECQPLVKKQPKIVVEKAENMLKKPGFISTGKYLKYVR